MPSGRHDSAEAHSSQVVEFTDFKALKASMSMVDPAQLEDRVVGRRVVLYLVSCQATGNVRVVEGVVQYISRSAIGVATDSGLEVVERGWIVAAKLVE